MKRDPVRKSRRQLVAGILALPLSVVPFLAYGNYTAEGRILRDRVITTVSKPQLPELEPDQIDAVRAAAPCYRDAVMPLVYHGIGEGTDGGEAVSPGQFGQHLVALREAGMQFVTAADVAAAFAGEAELPDNAVLVTFDDGRADAILWATPLLDDADAVATMFVITDATEEGGLYYAGWDQLEDLARSGVWDLQSHTAASHVEQDTHGGSLPVLTSLGRDESLDEYRARVSEDLEKAQRAIENHTGRRPTAFAYPFGAYGADRHNDGRIRDVLAEELGSRYELAFHQDEQETLPLATADHARLGLRRLTVGDWSGVELVRQIAEAADRSSPETRCGISPSSGT